LARLHDNSFTAPSLAALTPTDIDIELRWLIFPWLLLAELLIFPEITKARNKTRPHSSLTSRRYRGGVSCKIFTSTLINQNINAVPEEKLSLIWLPHLKDFSKQKPPLPAIPSLGFCFNP
jgi:hypothetical protein